MASRKPHEVLGVGEDASPEEIRAAFRGRAKEFHPDRTGDAGRERFEEARRAYEELSDPAFRQESPRRDDAGVEVPVRVRPVGSWRRGPVEPLRPSKVAEPLREWIRPLDPVFRRFR